LNIYFGYVAFFQSPVKAGFHVIAMIAAIAGKKRSAIVAIVWKTLFSDRSDHSISQRSLKSVFHEFAAIGERFFE